jgi:DNA-binding IclR family transcriptional regulator
MEAECCIYVYQAGQQRAEISTPHLGTRVGLHSSAAGKAILSTLSEEARCEFLESRSLPAHTPHTITDPELIRDQISEIATTKTAFDYEEQFPGIYCVSTPVRFEPERVGAVSMSVKSEIIDKEELENELADAVYRAGRDIEMDAAYESWYHDDEI